MYHTWASTVWLIFSSFIFLTFFMKVGLHKIKGPLLVPGVCRRQTQVDPSIPRCTFSQQNKYYKGPNNNINI